MRVPPLHLWLAALMLLSTRTPAQDSGELLDQHGRGVVIVRTSMDCCCGTVIDASGLIVTSLRLAVTPLPITVIVGTADGGFEELQEVELVGIHPRHELALLRVSGENLQLQSLALAPGDDASPSGHWQMIVRGLGPDLQAQPAELVTGAIQRTGTVNGLEYIQLSGQGKLVHAGGALCDEKGRLRGVHVVTESGEKPRRVVPVSALDPAGFLDPAEVKGDPQRAGPLAEAAADQLDAALALPTPQQRQVGASLAFLQALRSLIHLPRCVPALVQAGRACLTLGDPEAAAAFLERALDLDPGEVSAHRLLADLAMARSQDAEALSHWVAGLSGNVLRDARSAADASLCALYLAGATLETDPFTAAYLVQWSAALDPSGSGPHMRSRREDLRVQAVTRLTPDQLTQLQALARTDVTRYSMQGLDALTGGAPTHPPTPPPPLAEMPAAPPALAALVEKAVAEVETPVEPPESGHDIPLPGPPGRVLPALGGAYAVLQFDQGPQVLVIDLLAAEIRHTIELEQGESLVATGGERLAICDPTACTLRVLDLLSGKQTVRRQLRLPRGSQLQALAMGAAEGDLAYLSWLHRMKERSVPVGGILTLRSGKLRQLAVPPPLAELVNFHASEVIANLDLTRLLTNPRPAPGRLLLELDPGASRPRILTATTVKATMLARFGSDGVTLVDPSGTLVTPEGSRYFASYFFGPPLTDASALISRGRVDPIGIQLRTLTDQTPLGRWLCDRCPPGDAIACAGINRLAWRPEPTVFRIQSMRWSRAD